MNYPGDCGTPTVNLLTVPLLLNSVISTPNAKFMTIDIKYFYLNTPMARSKYMRLKLSDLPENVISHYNLEEKVTTDSWVYIEITRGMYGLPHAGLISQQLLEKDSTSRATNKVKSHRIFGCTNGALSTSLSVLTTLVSSTSANNMLTTLFLFSKSTIKYPTTGTANVILDLI